MKFRELFPLNKPGQPAKLAAIGVGILVLGILITALCLRSCQEPGQTEDPPGYEQNMPPGTEEATDAPTQEQTEPIMDTEPAETEPTAPPQDPEQTSEPTQQTAPDQEEPTEPDVTVPDITEPVTVAPTEPPTEPVTSPEKVELVCRQYAAFSGSFVEDGSDEPVENVAALLITNETGEYLDLGELIYQLDGQKAVFRVTGLPAGASAWVMEANRRTAGASSVFTQTDCTTTFRKDAVSTLEGLSIQSAGNMLKVTNDREKALKNVTLYYKVLHEDQNYFGGITYMVAFGDLEPGQSAEKLAGHFKEGWTDIVRIGYQEET